MSNTGRKINYAVRPAKNVERKMMRDLFLRFANFGRIEDYRYVGFGSKYFSDFILFHKLLNFSSMHSIEADVNNRPRYEFNKPYSSITMEWGKSTEVLGRITALPGKAIYWLDYDGCFEKYMLDDVALICQTVESGGSLSLSFNCDPLNFDVTKAEDSLSDQLVVMVGREFVDNDLDTRGWQSSRKLAVFLKQCISKKIALVLKSRNYGISNDGEKIHFRQCLFFTYADGAQMATVTFIFYAKKDEAVLDSCRLGDLYFVREGDAPFDISTPNLTIKEIRHLMEIRPFTEKINLKIFTEKDVKLMWENYRYFPGFSEIESF